MLKEQLEIGLQGRVRSPTGGIVRERMALIRCNSETDSIVWMEEDGTAVYGSLGFSAP